MTIVIIGAGPAGLAAAEAASAHGAPVLIIDDNPAPGGQIWRAALGDPTPARAPDTTRAPQRLRSARVDHRGHALLTALRDRHHVSVLFEAHIVAVLAGQVLLVDTPNGPQHIIWSQLILCTGARELLLPFPGWTLPGVTGAGGLQALVKGGLPLTNQRVIIAGTGPLLLASAATAHAAGAHVIHIAEHTSRRQLASFAAGLLRHPAKLRQAAHLLHTLRGTRYTAATRIVEARGDSRLRSVTLQRGGTTWDIECDYLAAGFGLVPETTLARLLGCQTKDGAIAVDHEQCTTQANVFAAGECTGIGGVDKSLAEGRIAGLRAAGRQITSAELRARTRACSFGKLLSRSFASSAALQSMCRPDTLVCRCEDVTRAQIEGHATWRDAKLQTRLGMGPCQGRVCASACEFLFGWDAPEARQPVFPTTAATLASVFAGPGGDS